MKLTKNAVLLKHILDSCDRIVANHNTTIPVSYSTSIKNKKIVQLENLNPIGIGKEYAQFFLTPEELARIKQPISCKLILRIMSELKLNNPLWECRDLHKTQIKKGMDELQQHGIVFRIPTKNLYYVTPDKICKGKIINVAFSIFNYLERKNLQIKDVTVKDIKKLDKAPDGYSIPLNWFSLFL